MYGGSCLYLHSSSCSLKECAPFQQSSVWAGLRLPRGEDGQQDVGCVGMPCLVCPFSSVQAAFQVWVVGWEVMEGEGQTH